MNEYGQQQTGKRALVCSYHAPQPDRDSGARRSYDFIRFLCAAGWQVSFLASGGLGDERDARQLRRRGIPVHDGSTINPRELFATAQFDLALLAYWPNGASHIPILREVSPGTRVIVDSVDLHFMREARQLFQRSSSPSANHLDEKHAFRMMREINTYAAADGVLAVSDKETQLINDLVGDARLAYTSPDGEEPPPSFLPFGQRKGILSVGSFQHHPNIGAIEYLCKEILPRLDQTIAAEHPVYIVGNALTEKVRDFARGLPHVHMVGWVPSVEPYFARARVSVVPLLYGAGTKRKIIQALMTGTPTVSTSVGIEGLHLRDGEQVLVADDPAGFAAAMTRLLTDEELWRGIAERGRAHIERTHNLATARARFYEAVEAVLAKEPKSAPRPQPTGTRVQVDLESYRGLTGEVRKVVREVVPPGLTVAVISKGDPELVKLDGRTGWHFPRGEDLGYAGHYPADGPAAVAHLEALRRQGAEFLVIPSVADWWLEFYPELRQHLNSACFEVTCREAVCRIYDLRQATARVDHRPGTDSLVQTRHRARTNGSPNGAPGHPNDPRPATVMEASAECDVPHRSAAGRVTSGGAEIPRLIAFYLPQFHPIPENNAWWGEGFTEWRNVAKADPLFPGHLQPHIPTDLGFYDLRCPETREQQAELAREYGIHGFCYYHFWFEGKRLLERPFNEVLSTGKPDFPFCLCWANDPWSRKWDGKAIDLIQPQTYSPKDDLNHIRWLLPALGDARAIQVDGMPVFLVYRVMELPDARRTIETWRREVERAGLKGIYLVAVETAWDEVAKAKNQGLDEVGVGFDATVLFQPQFEKLIRSANRIVIPGKQNLQVYNYADTWRLLAEPQTVSYTRFDTVCPGWDNTARMGAKAVVLHNATPDEYAAWLNYALEKAQQHRAETRFVFINAWNEWAEGCHLEPDSRHGLGYLEKTKRVLMASFRQKEMAL
jgi:glycosyltransferase involved in cell wall biosynthesis